MDLVLLRALLLATFTRLGIRCDDATAPALQGAIGQMPVAIDAVAAETPAPVKVSIEELKAQLAAKVQEIAELANKIKAAEAMNEPGAIQSLLSEAMDMLPDAKAPDAAAGPDAIKADSRKRVARAAIEQAITERTILDRVLAPIRVGRTDSADVDPAKLGHAGARRAFVADRVPTMKDGAQTEIDAAFKLLSAETRTDSADPFAAIGATFRENDAAHREGVRADAARTVDPLTAPIVPLSRISAKAQRTAHTAAVGATE